MTAKKSILFVNDEMEMGGVARVLNTLMRNLPQDKYDIDLLILHKEGMLLNEIPSHVRVLEGTPFFKAVDISLNEAWRRKDFFNVLRKLKLLFYMKTGLVNGRIKKERKKILDKQYDVEVAAKEGFCTVFIANGDAKKKINWVLTDYSVRNYSENHMNLVKSALEKIDLNIADSKQALDAFMSVFSITNGMTIHNLMDVDIIKEKENEELPFELDESTINVVNVARFHPQKSIDRLLNASYEASKKGLKHTLYLVGGGELEQQLRNQVKELGMDNVVFTGYLSNPYSIMKRCDLFVLSSLYEGYATVINESLITGTPVLCTDVSGCHEQITKPEHGWIVDNNQEALNDGLIKALSNPEELKKMKKALESYEYPNNEILDKFIEVF